MTHIAYNKRDIPRALQRLIDHTDRGIEQLYQLAGRDTATSTSTVADKGGLTIPKEKKRGRRRHIHHCDPDVQGSFHEEGRPNVGCIDSHCSIQKGSRVYPGGARADAQRGATAQSSTRRARDAHYYEGVSGDRRDSRAPHRVRTRQVTDDQCNNRDDRYSDSGAGNGQPDLSTSEDDVDTYQGGETAEGEEDLEDEGSSYEPQSLTHHRKQWRASRGRRQSPIAPTASLLLESRSPGQRHGSPASTPHRALDFSNHTAPSSPASLAKPPRPSRSSNLHPPPLHQSGFSSPPPWLQRREHRDSNGRHVAGGTSCTLSSASFSGLYGSSVGSSPSSIAIAAEAAAYHAHIAAQQSTQKPVTSSAAHRRRLQEKHSGTSSPRLATSLFMSPDSAKGRSRNGSGLYTHFGPQKTRDIVSPEMLSHFGRRWGNVFKDMFTDPSPSAPSVASSTPRRPAAAAAAAPNLQNSSPMSSPSSSCAPTTAPLGEVRVRSEGATEGPRPSHSEGIIPDPPLVNSSPLRTIADVAHVALGTLQNPVVSASASIDSRVVEQLRSELREREEVMLQLRMSHAREVAELRQSLTQERTRMAKQTADELATSFSIKEQLLQSSLQTERQRLAEAEEQLRLARREAAQRQMELEDAGHALKTLQGKVTALTNSLSEQTTQVTQWRAQAEKAAADLAQCESQIKVWRAREVDWHAREAELQQLAHAAEKRREQQEASAQTALAQVEAEFTHTSQSYQDLLTEATKRLACLEKAHRKYKLLKESHTVLTNEYQQLVDSSVQRAQQTEAELASLRTEAQELRQQLLQRDSATQQETASHQEMLSDYKRRLELQEVNAVEQVKTLQQHVDTANHTIELLRSQIDGLKQDILEEQAQHQQTQMKGAQAELQWKEMHHEQQRSAAAYKVRTEDTIAQLKRQLREKDTKMQTLAAGSAEPLQRLRQQLEDERGRRARLEEQFRAYKKKAKEAEEQAASEMRREQLRTALLTPAASSHFRFAHSATATLSPPSSFTPCRSDARLIGGGGRLGLLPGHQSDGPARPTLQVTGREAHDGQEEGRLSRSDGVRPATLPASCAFAKPHTSHPERDGAVVRRHGTASRSPVTPRASATRCASEGSGLLPRPRSPEVPPTPPLSSAANFPGEDKGGRSDPPVVQVSSPSAGLGAMVAMDVSAISPNATVRSLSDMTGTSPFASTLVPEEGDAGRVSGTAGSASAHTAEPPLSLEPRTANDSIHTAVVAAKGHSADVTSATHVYTDPEVQAHEYRMSTFRTSASEVLHRIAGSREEFLAQCAAIVKSTAAAGIRGARAGQRFSEKRVCPRTHLDGASVSVTSSSDEDMINGERL
ncbi:hypothetical protein JKF63_05915 [Porcisia hertigi]|uniref:Uncharacterized protein n=1 Tax=Porcisia hertigi TaxID=2761500 RepID=A0A836HV80_9TRYP|nr:hypothetical protein JKF63_05915 [Porcisia hertigi]